MRAPSAPSAYNCPRNLEKIIWKNEIEKGETKQNNLKHQLSIETDQGEIEQCETEKLRNIKMEFGI